MSEENYVILDEMYENSIHLIQISNGKYDGLVFFYNKINTSIPENFDDVGYQFDYSFSVYKTPEGVSIDDVDLEDLDSVVGQILLDILSKIDEEGSDITAEVVSGNSPEE